MIISKYQLFANIALLGFASLSAGAQVPSSHQDLEQYLTPEEKTAILKMADERGGDGSAVIDDSQTQPINLAQPLDLVGPTEQSLSPLPKNQINAPKVVSTAAPKEAEAEADAEALPVEAKIEIVKTSDTAKAVVNTLGLESKSADSAATKETEVSRFIKGPKIESETKREIIERYVYVSRAGWIIKLIQPHIDEISKYMLRNRQVSFLVNYTDINRSFSYLCMLIATDDGSKAMAKAITRAFRAHKIAVSNLDLQWRNKPNQYKKIFADYLNALQLKDVSKNQRIIEAGSLKAGRYNQLELPSSEKSKSGFINSKEVLRNVGKKFNGDK